MSDGMKVLREFRPDLVLRVRLLSVAIACVLVGVGIAFGFVQIAHGAYYRGLAESNRLRSLPVRASRGLIYDRRDRLLVENVPSYNLMLDRSRTRERARTLSFAAEILDTTPEQLAERLERFGGVPDFRPVRLAGHLSLTQVAHLDVRALEYPELEIDVEHLRLYRHGTQTGHVLGYLGEVSEAEIGKHPDLYTPGDLVGKRGVEQVYEPLLRGREGRRVVVVDSRGQILEEFESAPAESGHELKLTLDLDLQQEAARQLGDRVGAVVALEPESGEVLALYSSPGYDPNLFARGLRPWEWSELLGVPHNPLQNRALQNTQPPGSVFKIVMAAAGLGEGVVGPRDRVFCRGWTSLYNHRFHCGKRGGHGWVNLEEALEGSCNVYFYHLGQKLGIEKIAQWARRFGLGRPTGIELREEKSGLVPDPEWSLRVRGIPWFPGETISLSVGQGALLATPLQIARMMAAVANGGRLPTPHLSADHGPVASVEVGIDPGALETIRRSLTAVVNDRGGTAYWTARLPDMAIAGKTGTAQVVASEARGNEEEIPWEERTHAWFASFAPAQSPRLVIVVFVEHGGAGSTAAAPIARALYESYLLARSRDARPL